MKLYLVRHGETDLNKRRILQGRTDSELNAYGRELAYLTAEGLKDVPFDIAFTSPLRRAKETAQIILGERQIPLIEELRIQEIGFGDFEGLCYLREGGNIPDKTFLNFFEKPEAYRTPPNGESLEAVIRRTGEFLNELLSAKKYDDKTLLVSTHGGALKAILANVRQAPIAKFWGTGVHKNCAVSILETQGKAEKSVAILEEGIVFY